jgi:nicotinate-nucleotide pyrophosphorylase (carboxylating)
MMWLDTLAIRMQLKEALAEDVGSGDITTDLLEKPKDPFSAAIVAKEDMVIAGIPVVRTVLQMLDKRVRVTEFKHDGERTEGGNRIATVVGPCRALLTGERVALNFLQRMSGIATLTSRYVKLVEGTKAKIVDTRKTTPGMRRMEKYAVRAGGGYNHRFGLFDGVLIKDNHIAIAGGVGAAVRAARKGAPHTLKIEVEVCTLNQLDEAINAGADIVLLDNMPVQMIRDAVEVTAGRVMLEASGGINESNVREVAETGVDMISVGALTHSARAMDISMEILPA